MKTTKLMTAFALSAMFAACSQDAELNDAIAKNDFSNIPVVEANFTVNAGVDSRMATKFGWEVGDKVGFAWLGTAPLDLTGHAYQNHPLFCTDAKNAAFNTETMLYVGKYFAYMPYTAGSHTIEEIKFNVTGQPLTTNSNDLAKHAIYISPEVYELEKKQGTADDDKDKLASGMGNNLPLNIARVSNAATINLTFANAETLTDLKVLSVSLDAKKDGASVLPASFTYAPTFSAIANGLEIETWKDNVDAFVGETYTKGAIVASSKEGVAVVDDALTVYMLTMPVEETANDLDVIVTTNYGTVTVNIADEYGDYDDSCITFDDDADVTEAEIFNNLGSAGTMNVYVDMADVAVQGGDVKSQEELYQALDLLVVSGYDQNVTFNIVPASANRDKNFVFTDFALPAGLKAPITLTADGTKVQNGFVFNGTTVVDKELALNVASKINGTMTVNYLKDANGNVVKYDHDGNSETVKVVKPTLSGTGVITINNNAVLTNNGKIASNLATVAATSTKAAGKYVSNHANASVTGSFTNAGAIQWIVGTLPSCDGLRYAEVVDFTTLAKASAAGVPTARFVVNTTFANDGQNLNGTEFANIKNIVVAANVTINLTKNSITDAATTIKFGGLTGNAFAINKNASLTIVSDTKANKVDFGTSTIISVAENAQLSLTKITFQNASISNSGKVTTSGCGSIGTISGTGSSSNN